MPRVLEGATIQQAGAFSGVALLRLQGIHFTEWYCCGAGDREANHKPPTTTAPT
jgi:hypothetical protein